VNVAIRSPLAAGALLAALVAPGCSAPAAPARSAVLVTVDTWRADACGAGGSPDVRTPNLDRFFRGGTQFADVIAPIPTTLPSHLSMLTGLWPPQHGVPRNVWQVPDDLALLPEILREEGVSTAAFVSSAALDATTRIGRGFDVYDDDFRKDDADDSWRPAAGTLARASAWWRDTPGRKFLWVHLFEPHLPYRPAAEDARLYGADPARDGTASVDWVRSMWTDKVRFTDDVCAYLRSLYRAEVTGADRALGSFLRGLEAEGDVAVIVTSDHGESLGEHGLYFKHGPKVFSADVAVPLALRGPGVPRGLSGATVRTLDVPATIAAMLGADVAFPTDAQDLRGWESAAGGGLTAYSVASAPNDAPRDVAPRDDYANVLMPRTIRRAGRTFVEVPWQRRRLWFDRAADPGETTGLRPDYADSVTENLRADLEEWMAEPRVTESRVTVDPQLRERMRALGYLD